MIHFEDITSANVWQVCLLETFEEQKDFVAPNAISLAEAYVTQKEGNIALPFAVYNDDELVGFVMIGKGTVGNEEESELIQKNYCLWRLMIDKRYQGRGYGRETIRKVIDFVKTFPCGEADKLWLSFEPENTHAAGIYHKFGFAENGEMCENEIIAVLDLK